jgi:hypothetical protein
VGVKRGHGLVARTSHRFTSEFVETAWSLRRLAPGPRQTVDVLFPTWGAGARVIAILRDGGRRTLGARRLPLASIAWLEMHSRHAAYVVRPLRHPAGATVHLLQTRPQSSAPLPGPSLGVQLVRGARSRRAAFAARVTVVRGHESNAAAAPRLPAR